LTVSQRRARNRVALILGVGVVTAALGIVAYEFDILKSYELKTVDARFAIRGSTGTPDDVVNVLIDDVTFNELRRPDGRKVQWPYPRRLHAGVISEVAKGKPAAILYDVQFTEPTNAVDDNALILAAQKAGNVVFATTEVD
jgi:CHASE2 domain-containing sensor protein